MKVQLKDIILAVPALSKLAAGDLQLRFAYRLKRMISALQKEADFFAEQRQKIFEKYGTAKEDGTYDFSEENEPRAASELDELLEMEVMRNKVLNYLTDAYITAFGTPSEHIVLMKNGVQIPPERIIDISPLGCWW